MKMYEALALADFYETIKNNKMPIKTAYKMNCLMRQISKEKEFYQEKFTEIVNEYGQKDANDNFIFLENKDSIAIISGKEKECNEKIRELQNLEVSSVTVTFTFEEIENLSLDLSVEQINCLVPIIKE